MVPLLIRIKFLRRLLFVNVDRSLLFTAGPVFRLRAKVGSEALGFLPFAFGLLTLHAIPQYTPAPLLCRFITASCDCKAAQKEAFVREVTFRRCIRSYLC